MSETGSPTPRARPFYCPYCGEEDFVPFEDEPGRYHCNSCDRYFSVGFLGVGGSVGGMTGESKDAV